MIRKWSDAGVVWNVELSTDGPLIIGDQATAYPMQAGGQYGVPAGWTPYASTGAVVSEVNFTTDTALDRFSISNNVPSVLTGNVYGAFFNGIPIKPNHAYRVSFQCRTMDTKTPAYRNIECRAVDAGGFFVGGYFAPSVTGMSAADWEDISMNTIVTPANAVAMQIRFQTSVSQSAGMQSTWGLQWHGLKVVDIIPDSEIAPIVWRDITCDVRSIATRYGRERFTNRYDVASCNLTVNNDDGDYTYRDPHPFNLRPGRLLRARATHAGKTVSQFYGVIDSLQDGYALDGHAITSLVAYDPQKLFANIPTPSINFSPAAPLSGERIRGILDVIGYRPRKLDAGQWRMQSVAASGRTLRDEMGVTADSEGGSTFADRDGQIVYKDRTWETVDPNLSMVTADLIAGEHGDVLPIVDQIPNQSGSPVVCPFELQTNWALDRLMNTITLANAGGTAKTFVDADSQLKYGIATYQRTDYVQYRSDADANGYLATRANDLMSGYAVPVQRVNTVTFRPALFPGGWDWALALFLNWTVRVWYLNPLNGWGFATVTHVQAIEHTVTLDDWTIRLALDRPISFVTIENVPRGWDLGTWDETLWDQTTDTHGSLWNTGANWSDPTSIWGA